ncbi:MAG: hypothetical protein AAF772_03295 [Acidobacteriota bacterium]
MLLAVPWLLAALVQLRLLVGLRGTVAFDLYTFFSAAAALGWVAGNVYLARLRRRAAVRTQLRAIYLIAPPGLLFAAWALLPLALQQRAPFSPFYALAVYALFLCVPLTLRPPRLRRPSTDAVRRPPPANDADA